MILRRDARPHDEKVHATHLPWRVHRDVAGFVLSEAGQAAETTCQSAGKACPGAGAPQQGRQLLDTSATAAGNAVLTAADALEKPELHPPVDRGMRKPHSNQIR